MNRTSLAAIGVALALGFSAQASCRTPYEWWAWFHRIEAIGQQRDAPARRIHVPPRPIEPPARRIQVPPRPVEPPARRIPVPPRPVEPPARPIPIPPLPDEGKGPRR